MKTTLAMSALALSLGLALSPLTATAAETASSRSRCQARTDARKVMPSVVSINVEGSTTVNTPRMPRNFQQFFGDNSPFCQTVRRSRVLRSVRAVAQGMTAGRRPATEIHGAWFRCDY